MILQFTKTSALACLVLANILGSPAFAAGPVSLGQLIQTDGSLIDGDKKFAAFAGPFAAHADCPGVQFDQSFDQCEPDAQSAGRAMIRPIELREQVKYVCQ